MVAKNLLLGPRRGTGVSRTYSSSSSSSMSVEEAKSCRVEKISRMRRVVSFRVVLAIGKNMSLGL